MTRPGHRWRVGIAGVCVAAACSMAAGCATWRLPPGGRSAAEVRLPGRTVTETLRRAVALLESYDCAVVAVDFLSPIKRRQIADIEAYRERRKCGPADRGNLDDVLIALKLGLAAEPERRGVRAIIDLSGIGLSISSLELVRYIDGRWYFNDL